MTKQEMQRTIGHNLMKQRVARNMTREQISEKVGISTTFYANLECGNKMMSVMTLRKLADALCVSTDALLYDADTSGRLRSIERLLRDQAENYIAYIEDVIRLTLHAFAQTEPAENGEALEEEVLAEDGCAAAP